MAMFRGTITKVRYYNSVSGFAAIAVRGADGQAHSCVGNMPTPVEGMGIVAEAAAVTDRRYGRQLRLTHPLLQRPTARDEIARYLASGVIDGIG